MTAAKETPGQQKKRVSKNADFTVMIIRGVETPRSFSISPPIFWGALLFLGLCVAASVLFSHLYLNELQVSKDQSTRLAQLQEEMRDTREVLEGAKQRLGLLEERLTTATDEQEAEAGRPQKPLNPSALVEGMEQVLGGRSVLDVQQFTANKTPNGLNIRFRLVNIDPDSSTISGYVVMIAISRTSPPRYFPYPKLGLQDGVPINFEDGEYFKIRNYRTIRGRYSFEGGVAAPDSVRVLAYDESGGLIMKKEIPLDGA
ncbi:MAG: hypothetical protein ACLFUL_14725 [Desulfobacteraceae bacterium]